MNWSQVRNELSVMLEEYIQIDTSNPPGNEANACEWLKNIALKENIFDPLKMNDTGYNIPKNKLIKYFFTFFLNIIFFYCIVFFTYSYRFYITSIISRC